MKKLLAILLTLVLCLGMLVGCGPDSTDEISYNTDTFETDTISIDVFSRHAIITGESENKRHQPDASITVGGNEYTAEYSNHWYSVRGLMPDRISYYIEENNAHVNIDANSGKLVRFSRSMYDVAKEEKEKNPNSYSTEQNYIVAYDIAKEYVGDISRYDKVTIRYLDANPLDNGMNYGTEVTFTKTIQGYLTSDIVTVGISNSGIIETIAVGHTGAFDDFNETIDREKVNESINARIKEECDKDGATIDSISYLDQRLFKSTDSKYYLVTDLFLYVTLSNGEKTTMYRTLITNISD